MRADNPLRVRLGSEWHELAFRKRNDTNGDM